MNYYILQPQNIIRRIIPGSTRINKQKSEIPDTQHSISKAKDQATIKEIRKNNIKKLKYQSKTKTGKKKQNTK